MQVQLCKDCKYCDTRGFNDPALWRCLASGVLNQLDGAVYYNSCKNQRGLELLNTLGAYTAISKANNTCPDYEQD